MAMNRADTLPKILKIQEQRYGSAKVAMRKKDLGIWREYSWSDVYDNVMRIALGLEAIGVRRGDAVAIMGNSDPQWYWVEYGVQALGGAAAGLSPEATPAELIHFASGCNAKVVFVRAEEHVDTINAVRKRLPALERVVCWGAGLLGDTDPTVMTLERLLECGRKYGRENPGIFERKIDAGSAAETAAIIYTQGYGAMPPRLVSLNHEYLIQNWNAFSQYDSWHDDGVLLSYISPTTAADQVVAVTGVLSAGVELGFPEGLDTFYNDMSELQPDYLCCPSSFWEALIKMIQVNMARARPLNKALYGWSLAAACAVVDHQTPATTPTPAEEFRRKLANCLALRPLRSNLGLRNVRSAYAGASILSPDCLRYLRGIGINLKQMYAHSECGVVAMHRDNDVNMRSVGPLLEDGSITIGDGGRLIYKRRNRPVAPSIEPRENDASGGAALRRDELETGDVGFLDSDGHLVLQGRTDDPTLPGVFMSVPQLEARIRFNAYIRYALVFAGDQGVAALICIEYESVRQWAQARQITYSNYQDLAQNDDVRTLVAQAIREVNQGLPPDCRIARFVNLHKMFDVNDGELTRNGTVRRRHVEERYAAIMRAVLDGKDPYEGDIEIKRGDTSASKIKVRLRINAVERN